MLGSFNSFTDMLYLIYLELEIDFLDATHRRDRERVVGFLFVSEASLHQSFCSLHEHVYD